MTFDQLELFVAVFRSGSFVAAANGAGLSPSSVSRSIAALENTLGTRLFQRTTRQLSPTAAGQAFYERAVTLLELANEAKDEARDSSARPSGKIRVTASTSFGALALSPILPEFMKRFPEVTIDLILSDSRLDLVEDRIDLAVRHGTLNDSSLIASKLRQVSYKLVASPDFLERYGVPDKPEDLRGLPLLTFDLPDFDDEWRFQRGDDIQPIDIEPSVRTSNASALLALAKAGAGITLLADWTTKEALSRNELVELFPECRVSGRAEEHSLWMVYPSRKWLPTKTRILRDYLIEAFRT